jgi:acetylglutamate kinase
MMTETDSQGQSVNVDDKKQPLYIIKAGGNVIDDESNLQSFLKDFSSLEEKKILVHGGGKIATAIGEKLGIESNYVAGRRITGDATIDLVTMVYGGLVNKKIVAALQSMQCNAIGLAGADANVLPAKKRPVKSIDYGWVGDIDPADINMGIWRLFLDYRLVPVVAPLTHDGAGHILNTNADTIAAVLSRSLSRFYNVKLVYCFEKNGVLPDVNDEQSFVPQLNPKGYRELIKNKKLFAGILPKIDNAFDAVNNGVQEVIIGNSRCLLQLVKGESGTKIIS